MTNLGYFSCYRQHPVLRSVYMDKTSKISVSDLERDPRIRVKATGLTGTVVAVDIEPSTETPETIVWVAEDNGNPDWPSAHNILDIELENKELQS